MNGIHVKVEQDNGSFIAQGLEEPGVITQGRTLDEIVANIREIMELMFGQKEVEIELLLPSALNVSTRRRGGSRPNAPVASQGRIAS